MRRASEAAHGAARARHRHEPSHRPAARQPAPARRDRQGPQPRHAQSSSWTSRPPRSARARSSTCSRSSAACASHGVAVIYISHRLDEVFAIADRITVLRDGRVVGSAPARDAPPEAHQHDGRARPRGALPQGARWSSATRSCASRASPTSRTRDKVLDDVSVTVRRGEIVGMAGLMGAGRTPAARGHLRRLSRPADLSGTDPPRGPSRGFASPADAIRSRAGPRRRGPQAAEPRARAVGDRERHTGGAAPVRQPAARHRPARRATSRRGMVDGPGDQDAHRSTRSSPTCRGGNQQKVVVGKFLLTEHRRCSCWTSRRAASTWAPRPRSTQLVGELATQGTGVPARLERDAGAARRLRPHLRALRRPHHRRSSSGPPSTRRRSWRRRPGSSTKSGTAASAA